MNLISSWRGSLRKFSVTTAAGLAMAVSLLCGNATVAATLPVPCAATSCAGNKTPGFTAPTGFVTSGQATATQSGNTLTVAQTSNQAILNWSSFNVSADGKVIFNQPGATSIALNKIYQANPSTILGQVSANGQIYLINPNGFVFGAHATVNVAGLVASSLGLTQGDPELAAGILSPAATTPTPQSAFSSDGRIYVTDSAGNLVLDAQGNKQPVQIVVQQGAQINAADGGRVLLAGQNVTNAGSVTAPDGQVILAAGQSVYLEATPSSDPTLRGLVVEVGGNTAATPTSAGTGTTTNLAGGLLSAARGNVSLIGLAVNQSGRISATTAVTANGSVILQAGDYNAPQSGTGCNTGETLCVNQGGTLKLAATSEIDVLPDLTDTTTAVVAQAQVPSTIKLTGQEVDIEGGQINAPGGTFKVLAAANPDLGLLTNGNSAAQIQVDAGTSIDLAGSDAVVPMSANLVSIQLRSNELEDDPLQRNGPLEAQTVLVDVRDGKPPLISEASWQSALQGIEENILQRTSAGGSASFQSEGSVVVNKGATVNVSGGQWTYQSGVTQTSQLIGANGQTYNIATADPSLAYTGVLNPTYTQTYNGFGVQITGATPGLGHTEAGYSQGFSAGSVTFAAPSLALQGSLVGTAVNGPYQRSPALIPAESLMGYLASTSGGDGIATGGTLVIGESTPLSVNGLPDFFSPAVTFVANAPPIIVAEGAPLPPQVLQLPTSYITSGGFTQTQIYSDSIVTLPTGLPLNLGAGGSLSVVAPRILIGSDIEAAGGSIELQSAQTAAFVAAGLPRMGIDVANGVTLDVRGQWTNDSPDAPVSTVAPTYQNGGQIDLSLTSAFSPLATGGALVLGKNVSLEASGGAWVEANNTVVGGTGGKITLDATPYQSELQVGNSVSLDAFGVQGAAGGSFTLAAPRIAIEQGTAGTWTPAQEVDELLKPGGTFDVGAPLFSQFGFSNVSLTATAPLVSGATNTDVLTVETGTSINAQAQTFQLLPGYLTRESGGSVESFSQAQLLPEAERKPYTVALQVVPATTDPHSTVIGDLVVQQGASIVADPGSTLTLTGEGSVLVDGTLRAPGGTITAQITPPDIFIDPGYLPNQVLELGAQGVLDVSGATVLTPNSLNLPLGNVLAGGTIDLLAARGDIVADAGSSMNIQGASALLDVETVGGAGGYQKATVGSAGGTLTVESVESISLLGSLSAAGGASSSGKLAGGTLEVEVVPSLFAAGSNATGAVTTPLPSAPATIELVSNATGSTPTAPYGNLAVLGIEQLADSGIDALILKSDNTIALDSNTALTMGREVSLDAPVLSVSYGTSAAINAPYVALSNSNVNLHSLPPALAGTGALNVTAQQIVLSGNTTLQGVANATLTSSGDVELEPLGSGQLSGSLSVAGNLTIDAARLYPATQTSFTINDSGSAGTVTIGQTNASPGTPLSVAGSLTIDATNIVSGGTILAPFGQISLNATNSLSLQDGSVTSVSADGATLLYGQTVLGETQWVYDGSIPVNGVPTRQVSLTAPNVSFAKGATIDVSGGGNLSAYEFTAGTGGSVDALGQASANASGLYAVLPSTVGQYASYDVQEFTGSAVTAGESVYLSGVAGLPAGIYPLLPARYALLPGAYLVQVEPGYHSLTSGTLGKLTDGTPVVAGYTTFGTTGLQTSSGYTGFAVRPGSYAQSLAQYTISSASSYFAPPAGATTSAPVSLPADAGTLLFAASNSLSALGNVNSAAGSGGTAATIEISSSDLNVTASANAGTGASGSTGVSIAAPVIQSWNAGDLILGGELSADGSGLIVTAQNVTIGSGAVFSAGQVLAVADNSIEVQAGANVASTSGISGVAPKTFPATTALNLLHTDTTSGTLVADSGAALLAVSDLGLPVVTRAAGTTTGGSGTNSGGTSTTGGAGAGLGSVQIDSGAILSTLGAVALDAPGKVAIAGTINAPGASWSLASNSIAFVSGSGSYADTLLINPALLSQMQTAGSIQLTSAGSIDLLTNVALGAASVSGAPTLGSLGLTASSINNFAGGTSVFGGQTVVLQGVSSGTSNTGGSAPAPTAGTGTLTFVAGTLDIGGANTANTATASSSGTSNTPATSLLLNGNSQTTLQVNGAVVGQGVLNLGIAGNATIAATEVTAASGSATDVSVPDGTLSIVQNGTAAKPSTLTGSLGGQLTLSAAAIQDSGTIIVPGGRISLVAATDPNATGSGGSAQLPANITLGSSAVIDASGITVSQGNETIAAAGGFISLTAAGDLTLPAGSALSVSGASAPGGDAPAGFLSLAGGGVVTLGASLAGNAAADATGGSFSLDAGQLVGGLPGLTASLTATGANPTTGGFTNEIDIRVRTGDLDSAAGTTLTANQITFTADTGTIDIAGTLNAPSAGLRGSIGLFAGTGMTLESSGALLANGSGNTGRGGEIELSTVQGAVTLDSGSVISASGTAQGGSLLLRAPALMSSGDVAVSNINSTVTGLAQITIEPVLTTVVSSGDLGADFTQQVEPLVSSYLSQVQSSGTLAQRFPQPAAGSGQPAIVLEPGVVVDASGDLSLSQEIDLYSPQQSGLLGAPIDLTVRATGNVTIGGTISDGVSGSALSSSPSSSIRLVAGADLNSANPLATVAGSGANLTLTNSALVRTGTGDIDLVSSNDIDINAGSSAYTMGTPGAASSPVKLPSPATVNYPTGGGNVVVRAGEDVVGADQLDPQSASNWQTRSSTGALGFYGVNLAAFANDPWSLATFGGGDVSVTAARDVVNVSAGASDSVSLSGTTQTHFASGGMSVVAGRDVTTGQFFVADGTGSFTAGRSFATSPDIQTPTNSVGTIFELEDAQLSVWAQGNISIDGIINPTVLTPLASSGPASKVYFYTYTGSSAFSAQSSSGTVTLIDEPNTVGALLGSAVGNSGDDAIGVYPASLSLVALTSDLVLTNDIGTLFPSDTGQLRLFAGRDIVGATAGSLIYMSDAPDDAILTVSNVTGGLSGVTQIANLGSANELYNFFSGRHADDSTPASIVAGRDIDNLTLSIPKAADIVAGRDIVNLTYAGQNLNPDDVTLISAGRDFIDPPQTAPSTGLIQTAVPGVISLGGPGQLDILAGRNIDLGFSEGVITEGNLKNPNLPTSTGASITMLAGLGQNPDDTGFLQSIIEPSSTYQSELVSYVESLTGQSNLSVAQAETDFTDLGQAAQQSVVDNVFFSELNLSGLEAEKAGGPGYSRGYAAIDALFPGSRTTLAAGATPSYQGNLSLTYSQIYTLSGGDISLLVPGGEINVGLASPPTGSATSKQPNQLGIVAQGSGNVSIYSQGDVNVNSSRIFTIGGGNIVIWSDEGNIDAGNGAKTSLSLPPPTFTTDSKGNEELVFGAAVAGSGIRTIQTSPSQPAGDVNLIAPTGSVNAGDAGIGAAGNINIAAVTVTGASNINFGGSATGVPPTVSNVTASVSGASSAASATTNAATALEATAGNSQAAPLAQSAISWLDVFVTGLGDENCKPEDEECLKRQKSKE